MAVPHLVVVAHIYHMLVLQALVLILWHVLFRTMLAQRVPQFVPNLERKLRLFVVVHADAPILTCLRLLHAESQLCLERADPVQVDGKYAGSFSCRAPRNAAVLLDNAMPLPPHLAN